MEKQSVQSLFIITLGILLLFEGFSGQRSESFASPTEIRPPASVPVEPQPAARVYFRLLSLVSRVWPAKASMAAAREPVPEARQSSASPQEGHLCTLKQTPPLVAASVQP